jgi:hypothetical protein
MNFLNFILIFILFFEEVSCSMWNPLNWFRSSNKKIAKRTEPNNEKPKIITEDIKNIEISSKKNEEDNLNLIKNQLINYKSFLELRRNRRLSRGERRRRKNNKKDRIKPFRIKYNR